MCLVGLEVYHYYELLPSGQTINSNLDCEQLIRLKQAIDEKWPELLTRHQAIIKWAHIIEQNGAYSVNL